MSVTLDYSKTKTIKKGYLKSCLTKTKLSRIEREMGPGMFLALSFAIWVNFSIIGRELNVNSFKVILKVSKSA